MKPLFNPLKRWLRHPLARGQAILEFALILVILLALVFAIIEFGRAFYAYLSIVNAARQGVRYAVTGEYNLNHCPDYDGDGSFCAGPSRIREEDRARLLSIYDEVNVWRATLNPSYWKVTVCSSQSIWDRNADACIPAEDPGNPEGGLVRVMVAITYEHMVIAPFFPTDIFRLNRLPTIRLHAERSGILESFRTARVINLPPMIDVPTATAPPTPTPTPSPSPTITLTPTTSLTPTITPTPSITPTGTRTATVTRTPTITLTPTITRTPTITPIPTHTRTPTPRPTRTDTSIPPTPTETSLVDTPTPTTNRPTNTPTNPRPPTRTPTPKAPGGG